MSGIQAWLDQVSARLEAVKKEPAQEDRAREADSVAWSELYRHAPTDLTNALAALQAVLDLHDYSYPICSHCLDGWENAESWPCPTVRAIQGAIKEQDA